jgi:hypothetical protein
MGRDGITLFLRNLTVKVFFALMLLFEEVDMRNAWLVIALRGELLLKL